MCDVKLVLKLVLIIQLKKHRFKRVNAIKLSYRISVAKKSNDDDFNVPSEMGTRLQNGRL